MLGAIKLTVNATRELTCFAYINIKYCTNAQETECVRVQVGEELVYLWAVFLSSVPERSILINPLYLRVLKLSLFKDVYVCSAHNIRSMDTLLIEADSFEDQVILEHNQAQLQTVFLNHVRLVVANQKAVVWLSPSIPIVFTPQQTGILVNHTSVVVKLIDESSLQSKNSITHLLNPIEEEAKKNSYNAAKGLLRPLFSLPKRMALRALPMESKKDGKKVLIHPFVVFMHEDLVDPEYKDSTLLVALMKSLPSIITSNKEEVDSETSWQHEICVRVVAVNSIVFRSLSKEVYSEYIPTVLIPHSLNEIIDVYKGTMVMLTFIDSKTLRPPENIDIVTYNRTKQHECTVTLVERFKSTVMDYLHSGEVFLMNHDTVMQNSVLSTGYIKFRLSPNGLAYTTLTEDTFKNCTVSARSLDLIDMKIRNPNVSMTYDYKSYCRTIKPLELLMEKVMSHIYFDIHRGARFNKSSDLKSSVLVTGPSGTGKSTLCNLIEKEISVFSYILQCRPLKGRKDIGRVFTKAVMMCSNHRPSLLILDDLDALLPSNMEGLSPQDIAMYNGQAVEIKQTLFLFPGVSILMTARVVGDLHPIFRVLTGQPLFTAQFPMPELDQDDRIQLFKHLLSPYIHNTFLIDVDDVIRLAMDSSGYSFREIMDYFGKKLYAAVKKKNADPKGPKQRIVVDVTKDTDQAKAFDIWGPLGGLGPVKEKLNECIFWPVMYPALFPSQSCGILLYGPPGTGKSLIGSCLARLHGFNIITVKGPELLSKYIGQSEAAVREVFDKADMKRPCILFFDEFDSLAPKRGHDSTGVTDRVVNQLLARLDGAEGGARGPVLAATSRPDLLDPALLRAGRLATHLHCDLPTLDGRLEVLRTLAQQFHIRASVELARVAEATEGYTPADLKALLVTAQLSRLDLELLQVQSTDDDEEPTLETVEITNDDITHALADTKPSLSKEQRQFYDSVYRRFRGESYPQDELTRNSMQMSSTYAQLNPRMRVTLA